MIPAIVLAAGLSRRMGRFKLTLPWGETTVIGQVIATLEAGGITQIVVVTGHRAAEIKATIPRTIVHIVYNPHYATGEMLSSIQAGVRELTGRDWKAALLCLGDQPQMQVATVRAILAAGAEDDWSRIVIPSYRRRAGHPILLPAWLWPEILAHTGTLRDVLTGHRAVTHYLAVDTPTVLADLDTPEDYAVGREKSDA